MAHARSSLAAVGALIAALATAVALAQAGPTARSTGTIDVAIEGEGRTYRTFAVDVPENVADGITDPALRARLERAAGTTEHGATWNVPEPVLMGEVVLFAPQALYVEVAARPTDDPEAGLGEVRMSFGLDLTTLALSGPDVAAASVRYYPERFSVADYYELTEGGIAIESVEQVDARTLRIVGTFEGTFSFQATRGVVEHDPSDTLSATGRFELTEVVGDQDLADVLVDE